MSPRKAFFGELISECIAVFIIIAIGCSAAAMFILYDPSPYKTAYFGVCITWGLAVTIAIYVTGAVSGTHANPAVTLALAVYRGFPKNKVVPFWIAQTVGAFLGAAVVYMMFSPVIDAANLAQGVDRAAGGGAGVFFTAPGAHITPIRAFFNEIVLTGILLLGIFAITEEYNTQAPEAKSSALIIGLLGLAAGVVAVAGPRLLLLADRQFPQATWIEPAGKVLNPGWSVTAAEFDRRVNLLEGVLAKAQPGAVSREDIVELLLGLLRLRLADRHIELELSGAAKEHIAREGYDPVYGARPLKRYLQRQLETALSRKLLAGDITDHSRVTVDLKKGELVFESKAVKAAKE